MFKNTFFQSSFGFVFSLPAAHSYQVYLDTKTLIGPRANKWMVVSQGDKLLVGLHVTEYWMLIGRGRGVGYNRETSSFYCFRGCVCTDFRVYSGVGVVGVQLTKYSLHVQQTWRALQLIARLCETCMHRRQRLSLASALLSPDRTREKVLLEFLSYRNRFLPTVSSCPKTVFPRVPLYSRWTTHLLVTCWYTSALFEGALNKFLEISPLEFQLRG